MLFSRHHPPKRPGAGGSGTLRPGVDGAVSKSGTAWLAKRICTQLLQTLLAGKPPNTKYAALSADLKFVMKRRTDASWVDFERIERNLSGLIGPHSARDVVNIRLPVDTESLVPEAERMRSMEETLEASRSRRRGLAAQLDALRRYHRQVLEELPVGVCSVSPDGEITGWNRVMEKRFWNSKNDARSARRQAS